MIYRRKQSEKSKGKWYLRKRINGKLVHRVLDGARTKAEADILAAKIIAERQPASATFASFVNTTYTKYVHQHNENVYVKELIIDVLIKHFGNKKLSKITSQDCRDFQYIRLHTPVRYGGKRSPASVNKEMSTLSKIFTLAYEHELITDNPMKRVKKLREAEPRKRRLTSEQLKRLWIALESDPLMKYFVTLAVNLPLRKGQIHAIQPEDIIPQGLLATASKGKPKRLVPLNRIARETLEEMKADGLLPFPITNTQKRWKKILVSAGINSKEGTRDENFHIHDLRHHFGSELRKKGVNPYLIQDLFAHEDMKTSSIYISNDFDDLQAAVDKLVS